MGDVAGDGRAATVDAGAGPDGLRRAAADCTACALHVDATQTVFGAGRAGAPLVLVGEQPGDREDRVGEPFVGPRAACWTGRWSARASTAPTPTSPTS